MSTKTNCIQVEPKESLKRKLSCTGENLVTSNTSNKDSIPFSI